MQAGLRSGNSQGVMLCIINESELEYTLERGLSLAEAHEWITRPAPARGECRKPARDGSSVGRSQEAAGVYGS